MNLEWLVEARSRLNHLASVASVVGPHPEMVSALNEGLVSFGLFRAALYLKTSLEDQFVGSPIAKREETITPTVPIENVRRTVSVSIPAPKTLPSIPRRTPASNAYNPERYVPYRVLWAKVIIRAAYDYALWKDSKDLRLKKYAQDAERWLFESSSLSLSFENICFAFDFPVERIRKRTRALTKQDVKKLEFRERHGRVDVLAEVTSGNDE